MPVRSRSARALLGLAALAFTAAACGSSGYGSGSTTTSAGGSSTSTSSTTVAGGSAATVEVADSDLGKILTSDGKTLYTYQPDDGGPSKCTGDSATAWPPLVADTPTGGSGLDASLLATAMRDDGGAQVTVNGWPLYFFSGDSAAGDVNGQGLGGIWYVMGADGERITG